jgi:chitinase
MHVRHSVVGISIFVIMASCAHVAAAALLFGSNDTSAIAQRSAVQHLRAANDPWVLAYYVGYHYSYLKPRDIDYALMTHIVVGGVGINADGTLNEHWHMPEGDGHGMALEVGVRAKRAGVKTLVWLGGPNEEDKLYAATTDAVRPTTVKNILKLVDTLDYDGVDIDWEPVRTKDEPGLLALVRDLRAARPNLLITVPVNWVPTTILVTKDLSLYPELAKYADRLFVMSYSMAGPWPGWHVWHGGALTGDTLGTPGSVRSSILAYTRAGVPRTKLGLGVGTYATCWEYPAQTPDQMIPAGFSSGDVHAMSMRTLMDGYYSVANVKWDARAVVPYLSFSIPRGDFGCGFISYENERSVREKAAYVKTQGLGGIMVWNIGTGYFPDASRSKRNPLLSAIANAF